MQYITNELDKEASYYTDEHGGIHYYVDEEFLSVAVQEGAIEEADSQVWKRAPIITIAATNQLGSIDEALDNRTMFVKFLLPDISERKEIIDSCNDEWESQLTEKDIDRLASKMRGYSQRDITNIFKLARRNAKMAEEDSLSVQYVEVGIEELKNKKVEIERIKKNKEYEVRRKNNPGHVKEISAFNQYLQTGLLVGGIAATGFLIFYSGGLPYVLWTAKGKALAVLTVEQMNLLDELIRKKKDKIK